MKIKSQHIRLFSRVFSGILLLAAFLFRWMPGWGEWYACVCYPYIAGILSAFSSVFPFSVGDCFIVAGSVWIVGNLVYAFYRYKEARRILLRTLEFGIWVYVWFYFAWGINYFRSSFYERTGIERIGYSSENFQAFLDEYVKGMNESYILSGDSLAQWYMEPYILSDFMNSGRVEKNIEIRYQDITPRFGLIPLVTELKAKPMLWSRGMSNVGVTGYMGPFFVEFNLNRELLCVEYPFTYAHELAHRLGTASEAEANLYAYLVCVRSENPKIRFSGYFSLFGYVMGNARRLLPEDEYGLLYKKIQPEIIELYKRHINYWQEKYSPEIGRLQNKIYNFYLKSNKVASGTKNYSEVVGLLISLRESLCSTIR